MLKLISSLAAGAGLLMLAACGYTPFAEAAVNPQIKVGGSLESIHDSSVTDAEIGFRLIFNSLLEDIHESFTIKIYDSNQILVDKFKSGEIEGILVSSLQFLKLDKYLHPTGRYAVQYGPDLKQPYLVLIRKTGKAIKLADFRGGRLSYGTGHSVGRRFLDVTLMQQGYPASERFFREIETVKEVNTSIVNLYFGSVDVALVPKHNYDLALELNPQLADKLQILTQSKPMIYQAFGMRYDFPQDRLERIDSRVLEPIPKQRTEKLFKTFRIKSINKISFESLQEVIELDAAYNALIQAAP
ncbi:MAG: PhnD/SsuA/transferrin family substrate-binding protein [Candidatus Thiodiazotropha sp.]